MKRKGLAKGTTVILEYDKEDFAETEHPLYEKINGMIAEFLYDEVEFAGSDRDISVVRCHTISPRMLANPSDTDWRHSSEAVEAGIVPRLKMSPQEQRVYNVNIVPFEDADSFLKEIAFANLYNEGHPLLPKNHGKDFEDWFNE